MVTPYVKLRGGDFRVDHPGRSFDRPVGWMIAGMLGVLREEVAGVRTAIAARAARRCTGRTCSRCCAGRCIAARGARALPDRLLVSPRETDVARRALRPGSLFLHAHRPLITEDGTSPILHEVVHTALRSVPAPTATGRSKGWPSTTRCRSSPIRNGVTERMQIAYDRIDQRGREATHLRSKTVREPALRAPSPCCARSICASARRPTRRAASTTSRACSCARRHRLHRAHAGALRAGHGQDLSSFFKSEVP